VPAAFRAALGKKSKLFAFPSFLHEGIECRTEAFMEAYSDRIGDLDPFSDAQDHLAEAIFATSHALAFDAEGRVVLHETLREHTGIIDRAVFVGKGKSFQIWEPSLHDSFQKRARTRALADRLALRQRPQAEPIAGGSVENGT
jgi:MraZ protein|tara:strand:+ start:564 stop:992 length:429 start_codon:yes stop_codon:yes gene_type:complete